MRCGSASKRPKKKEPSKTAGLLCGWRAKNIWYYLVMLFHLPLLPRRPPCRGVPDVLGDQRLEILRTGVQD